MTEPSLAQPSVAAPVVVVGIGADGWAGLAPTSRAEVERAEVLLGSARQLELVPPSVTGERVPWPSPMSEASERSRPAASAFCNPSNRQFTRPSMPVSSGRM